MTNTKTVPIFDGHNDTLLRLIMEQNADPVALFLNGRGKGHIDLPRALDGGFAGGLFAIFVPNQSNNKLDYMKEMAKSTYDVPLPNSIDQPFALQTTLTMMALLSRIERASDGRVKVCLTANDIEGAIGAGVMATVLHIEGAEAIDPDFEALEVLYNAGLRSIGPVWSRPNIFGHGVPLRFPGSPDTGPGLTDHGRELVKACNELGLVFDLSHLNEKGFWDVAKLSDAPLVATHSNAHALSNTPRNLTDDQLSAIRQSSGMVGVNFATCFLREDGRMNSNTGVDEITRHFDYLIEKLGVEGVGFGSDFDGAIISKDIADVAGLGAARDALRKNGYDEATLIKLCHQNWVDVLRRTWGE